ncbi:MAG TPA: carboxypeptidase regulatory-like domain-containing protein [Thermodesulfobacteriota bacterium]|nr:carboxypeptidase regulatory-like domain-containing protein [Thermodesulfobacteriota bacterium]
MKKCFAILICSIFSLGFSISGHSQNSNSTKNYGLITGQVTVLEKKFMGGMKEKDDMSGVVVYLTGFQSEPPREVHDLVQEDKTFHPMLLPIVAGQTVTFPNHDDIYHNVFSVSPVKSFDLGQYKSTDPPKDVTFDKPGLVPVYCNIHPQMISFVLVLENKAYAQTGKDGKFTISNVPPGRYSINVWKPRTQRVSKEIEVLPGQELFIDFELKEIEKIPPHKRKDGTDYPEEEDNWE